LPYTGHDRVDFYANWNRGTISLINQLIISVSGLRGIVGEGLTPDVAGRYAAAFAEVLPAGPVLITRDGRANGGPLVAPVAAGLSQSGSRHVLLAGIAATPTTGVLVRTQACAGGVQISASHNPAEYNGLKLFTATGRVIPAALGETVLTRYKALAAKSPSNLQPLTSNIGHLTDSTSAHLALVAATVNADRIRARRFRVLLDANHGSGSILGRALLENLGCDVMLLGGEADGRFEHPPEPSAENLCGVLTEVTRANADVGFAQDPDADRLAIIDERGRYIGEEYTLALCTDHVLRQTPGPVVTNCSSSLMTEDLARKHGVPYFRSAVGEANVVELMLREQAVIGGEGNGGVIDPRVGLVRDSFAGMALVLDAMAARALPVSALADELPCYHIHKAKVTIRGDFIANSFDALQRHFRDAVPDRLDGLRLDFVRPEGNRGWILVRASNTEPVVRIIAESQDANESRRLCDEAARTIAAAMPA
jgi:phosphomannomutase